MTARSPTDKPEFVLGRIPARECLRAKTRAARKLYLLREAEGLHGLESLARQMAVPVQYLARAELDRLAQGQTHQGAVLEADPLPVLTPANWAPEALSADALLVLLDGVEDPHNFGAIIRSAAACGAAAVVFPQDRAAPLSPAAVKAAAGGAEYVPLVRVPNLVRTVDTLKQSNYWVYGLDAAGETLLWQADLRRRVALVIGSEGKGMRRLVRDRCDALLRIPLSGPITSLNASVSAAIALAEALRQRTA